MRVAILLSITLPSESVALWGRASKGDTAVHVHGQLHQLTNVHVPHAQGVVEAVLAGRQALVIGPHGVGKSTLLSLARTRLCEKGIPAVSSSCREPTVAELISSTPIDTPLFLDDLDAANLEVLTLIWERRTQGGIVVSALNNGSNTTEFSRYRAEAEQATAQAPEQGMLHVNLEPLPVQQMKRIIHQHSAHPLDAVTVDAISALSHGRVGWAVALLKLEGLGFLAVDPFPRIRKLSPEYFESSTLRNLHRTLNTLDDQSAAVAIGLSQVDPMNEQAIKAIAGEAVTSCLADHGVLLPQPDEEHLTVPKLVAAILKTRLSPGLIEQVHGNIATRIAGLHSFGIPLTEQDEHFCAYASSHIQNNQALIDCKVAELRRAINVGDSRSAEALLLQFNAREVDVPVITRAKLQTVFGHPERAIAFLDSVFETTPPDVHRDLELFFTSELLRAERSPASLPLPPAHKRVAELTAEEETRLVIRLWNTRADLEPYVATLSRVARQHAVTEVRELALSLIHLHDVWNMRIPRHANWFTPGAEIPLTRYSADYRRQDIGHTTIITHALTMLLAGELEPRQSDIAALIATLPSPTRERLWLTHLLAANEAIMCGEAQRALAEWRHLVNRLPRFLPDRLVHVVDEIGTVIEDVAEITGRSSSPRTLPSGVGLPHLIAQYLSGSSADISMPPTDVHHPETYLPVVQEIAAHLRARAAANPHEIVRVADRFLESRMWVPSARAYIEARGIFVSRRSSTNVKACDEKLAFVTESLIEHIPWLTEDEFQFTPPVRLSPREHEVAVLVAQGFTNRDIAVQLHCTVRTVESHVASARAKMGAANRHELGLLMTQSPE